MLFPLVSYMLYFNKTHFHTVDQMIQYGEDQDVKARDDPEMTEEQEDFFDKQMKELGIND